MFRIHNNSPAVSALTQRLPNLRFDTHQTATRPGTTTGTASQMTIVGRPNVTDRQRTELSSVRQTNQSIASAATTAQVAEAGLVNVQVILQQLYELSVRASDAEISATERQMLIEESRRLQAQLEEVSRATRISGLPLLNGAQQSLTFQIGDGMAGSEVHLALLDTRPATLLPGLTPEALGEPAFARSLTEVIKDAIQTVQERESKVIAFQERLYTVLEQVGDLQRRSVAGMGGAWESEDAQDALTQTRAMILSVPHQAVALQAAMLSQGAMALIAP